MIANGTSGNGACKFTCQVLYRRRKNLIKQQKERREHGGYRGNRLVNDAKENRKNGKTAPRRRSSVAFDEQQGKCGFRLSISVDPCGYYIKVGKN